MPQLMPPAGAPTTRAAYLALCDPVACRDPFSAPAATRVRAGATLPVKWRVLDDEGAPVSGAGHFAAVTSAAPFGPDDPAAGVGPWYLGDGYWQFDWSTPSHYAGQLRTMTLALRDGSTRSALLRFC